MALRNNCSLTAGKKQYSAGQETEATGERNKGQRRRKFRRLKQRGSYESSPERQSSKHFQYGRGVMTEPDEQGTFINANIQGKKKFVTGMKAVDPAEGTPPKRVRLKRGKKAVGISHSAGAGDAK